jgi:hypothetical protein
MIDSSVPMRSARWSGTGSVIVYPGTLALHHHVTAALADQFETVLRKDASDVAT